MEQLGHVGRRGGGGGRWDFRYSLQTLPRREASVKKKKKKKKGMKNALEKRSAVMKKKGVNRKCVKDETTCHREGSEARREKLREP